MVGVLKLIILREDLKETIKHLEEQGYTNIHIYFHKAPEAQKLKLKQNMVYIKAWRFLRKKKERK